MKWSLKLGTYAGIGVYLHWTFALLLGWVFATQLGSGQSPAQALVGVLFVLTLFACVVLHEFGHALAARRYGIATRDITLLPIGGVARLERIPEKPAQELVVALAGPAVNVLIAAVLFVWLIATGRVVGIDTTEMLTNGSLVQRLMVVNVSLVVFNMLPAFPMDGGRALRALLAFRLGRRRATTIAASIGQAMAIVFGFLGLWLGHPLLVLIAIFVFLGAQAEAGQVEMQSALEGLRVGDAMMTYYRTLEPQTSLIQAVKELLAGSQQDFPIVENDVPIGILRRNDLVKALTENRGDTAVTEIMWRECQPVDETAPLRSTVEKMQAGHCGTVPVIRAGRLVGLLTMENIGELIMVQNAAERRAGSAHSRASA
ncbi:MAG: site-2 protease family protein [Opitutaceae bacterium]|nr:site-2 protease family protein [Opitutaceae bacterium]